MLNFSSIVFVHGLFGHYEKTWTYGKYKPEEDTMSKTKSDVDAKHKGDVESSERSSSIKKFWKKFGDHARSDAEDDKAILWPRDLLPLKIPDSRIFTWGYDVDIDHVFSSASKSSIYDHAGELANNLADERCGDEEVLLQVDFHQLLLLLSAS